MYARPRMRATAQIGPTIAPASFALELLDAGAGVGVVVVAVTVDDVLELVVDGGRLMVLLGGWLKAEVGNAPVTVEQSARCIPRFFALKTRTWARR
jgi:hypothetical protein